MLRRKMLDAKKKWEFEGFLGIDMGISLDEWMTSIFRSKVPFVQFVMV